MPELDGVETIKQIKSDSRLSAIPVVALTARTGDKDRQRALRGGACAFLAKPVELADLKLALDQYLCKQFQQDLS